MKAPYIIASGRKNAMYTLMGLVKEPNQDGILVEKYQYICNLSIDKERALEKANHVTNINGDIPFVVDGLNDYETLGTKQAIQEAARIQREAEQEANKQKQIIEQLEMINEGLMPFGPDKGYSYTRVPISKINWLIHNATLEENKDDVVLHALVDHIKQNFPELVLPEVKGGFVGEPKQRMEFNVTCVRSGGYMIYDHFGRPQYCSVTTFVDDEGHCLVVKSTAYRREVGEKLKIKATVKEHSVYRDVEQTIIQRVVDL